jgi:hypothetical protein
VLDWRSPAGEVESVEGEEGPPVEVDDPGREAEE